MTVPSAMAATVLSLLFRIRTTVPMASRLKRKHALKMVDVLVPLQLRPWKGLSSSQSCWCCLHLDGRSGVSYASSVSGIAGFNSSLPVPASQSSSSSSMAERVSVSFVRKDGASVPSSQSSCCFKRVDLDFARPWIFTGLCLRMEAVRGAHGSQRAARSLVAVSRRIPQEATAYGYSEPQQRTVVKTTGKIPQQSAS
jgi:hypothetical protein